MGWAAQRPSNCQSNEARSCRPLACMARLQASGLDESLSRRGEGLQGNGNASRRVVGV